MRPDAWSQVDELFHAALEIEPVSRAAFLRKACCGDTALQSDVESLLTSDSCEWDLIESSALESAAILLADEEPRLTSGQTIAHYEIKDLLGQGGMGEVYLAHDEILGRMVALKLLPADCTQDRDRLLRFEREARTISALNHPNILTVHEFGFFDDQRFIATEFVDGETLRERLARGPMSIGEVVELGCQLAGALAAAHGAGVIHRDIKPENIMLRTDGYVKVLDFGLAKLTEEQESQPTGPTDPRSDISSRLMLGTPRYMAPEQTRGTKLDGRADIFSLGAVLYEALAGRPAFDAKDPAHLARSILSDEPPALSGSVSRVIAKMLSKDPDDRYQIAEDVREALKRVGDELTRTTEGRSVSSTAGYRQRLITPTRIFAVLTLVTILAGAGYLFSRGSFGRGMLSSNSSPVLGSWLSKAPLSAPRSGSGLAVLGNKLYAIGGSNGCKPFSDTEVYDPASDTWLERSPLPTPRGGLGVAVLYGKIYSVGGLTDCDGTVDTVEAYDAWTDQWSAVAPLPTTRAFNSVAAFDGKLYSIGGRSGSEEVLALNTRYDPQTDAWTEMASMPTPRMGAGVAVLNGLIYVIGGTDGSRSFSTVEAYDPKSNIWTTRRAMLHPRDMPAVAELNGLIYSIGGSAARSTVEAYDPAADSWTEVTALPARRYQAPAIAFEGSIYIAGGFDGSKYLSSVLTLTDGSSSEVRTRKCPSLRVLPKAKMPAARHGIAAGSIGGIAYLVGGYRKGSSFLDSFLASSEAYDPVTDTWAEKAPMNSYREAGSNSAVVDEKLYVIGGTERGQCTKLNQMYDPATNKWLTRAAMPTPRCHLAVVAHNGLIYAIGGVNTSSTTRYATVEVYDPATDSWSNAPSMPTARYYPGAVSLNGMIYVFGGFDPLSNPTELNVLEVFDPVTGTWTRKSPMIEGRMGMATGVLNGMIVVFGGYSAERYLSTAEIYDPARDIWTRIETEAVPRANASAVAIDDTLYIFGGSSMEAPESLPTNEAFTLSECQN